MKKIQITIVLLVTLLSANRLTAQDTKEYMVDGIKVIHKQVPKDVISVQLFIEGGTANYTKDKQGIENLTLNLMMDGGTTGMSKLEFKSAAEKIGTTFNAGSNIDAGTLSMNCIKLFWDDSWKLFSDAILHPAFGEAEYNLLREQLIAGAQQSMADPDTYLALLSRQVAFENKDYAKAPEGTPETLTGITLDDVKTYYKKTIGKKRVFLVVVGNISQEDLTAKIHNTLAALPGGSPASSESRTLITQPKTYIEDRDIATNYIRGIMSAPFANDAEGIAYRVAISIVGDRYFTELRTKRSLSYAPAAFYANAGITNPYGVIYITTIDPKQSMQVMVDELNKIKKEGFTEKELRDKQQEFLTTYYLTLETTANQSNALGMAEMSGGWENLDKITAAVNSLKLEDINAVFDKYSNAIVWTYLGKKSAISEADFPQTIPKEKKNKPY
ncbi:MAG TPA: pitrilysin family protein [Chitinophagales bacterium]|nr:pitrilysin family protein [Chitinophagales bacterium]